MKQQILTTADGSATLQHGVLGELYHSDRGAIGEAQHVYIGAGFDFLADKGMRKITVLEAGFGTGLNCWLTMQRAVELGIEVEYHCIEKFPVDIDTAKMLQYSDDERFMHLHTAPWGTKQQISESFTLLKYQETFEAFDYQKCQGVDLVYWDAFSPDIQAELWSSELFVRIYGVMNGGGILVTYSAKGLVKENLRGAGFEVTRLQGALGKRHMVRGVVTDNLFPLL